MIPIRFYIYAGVALLIGGLLWKDHYNVKRLNAARTELRTTKATLEAERENTRKANESAKRYASRLAISRGPRSPPISIMCKLPKLPGSSTTPGGTDDPGPQHFIGVPEEVDIGPRIDVPFRACEENLIKLDELQRWVRER